MIIEEITDKYDKMSKTQKKIAGYILQNVTSVSYFNIKKLAQETKVSEASIIRFCAYMGYKGYPELKQQLQTVSKEQRSMRERLQLSEQVYDSREAGVAEVFHQESERLQSTLAKLDMNELFSICNEILSARKVYIVAARSAAALGIFFQYYLKMIRDDVILISGIDETADELSRLTENDMVIGISFERYTKSTEQIFHYAAEHGAVTAALTDYRISPLVKDAKYVLYADTSMPTYLDSFVAPLTIINAILTQIAKMDYPGLKERISRQELLIQEFDIFE